MVVKLAVTEMPGSGKPAEMLHAAGIDADCIANAARDWSGEPEHHRSRLGRRD